MSRSQKLAHGLKLTKSLFDLVDRHNLNGDEVRRDSLSRASLISELI